MAQLPGAALPSFAIEIGAPASESIPEACWGMLNGRPVILSESNFVPKPYLFEEGRDKICVLGLPIYEDRIDHERLCRDFVASGQDPAWLSRINGEFAIVHLCEEEARLRIISCRFAYPPIWYSEQNGHFIAAYRFSQLWQRLAQLGRRSLNEDAFFDLLRYKRVFGSKTPDSNTRMLEPSRILTFDGTKVTLQRYWRPNFREKIDGSLDEASDLLIEVVKESIRRKSSDGRRPGLFLSGGMDTRLVLACFAELGQVPQCFTINAFENREVRVAREVAEIAGAEHHFVQTRDGHYRKTFQDGVNLTGAMAYPMCMFLGHQDEVREYADVGFHGHGFDYFFQGMYLPRRNLGILGRRVAASVPRKLPADIVGHFLENVNYRVKSADVIAFSHAARAEDQMARLRGELSDVLSEADEICSAATDKYEYLSFHNLARHYSIGDHWGINTVVEQRTVSFDNDIYDLYQRMPAKFRFDARLQRRALRRLNPRLADLISANTTYPIWFSSWQRTMPQLRDSILRFAGLKPRHSNLRFERMGLPVDSLLVGEWRDFVAEMVDSTRLEQLSFLDMDRVRERGRQVTAATDAGDDQFVALLVVIDQFLKQALP